LEASINTPRRKLIGWPGKSAAALAKTFKHSYKGLKNIRPALKEDINEKALDTKESVLRARRKTIALLRRPMNDISHISIMLVISVALLSGVSAMFGSSGQVSVNPFTPQKNNVDTYVSATQKRIMQADLVTTLASIHSDTLGADAVKITEGIYKSASTANPAVQYLASVPIVQTVSATATGNTPTEYTVQDGDTLSTIAVKYNITTDTIRYANGITDVDSLKPGQTLTILPVTGVYYTVKGGDTTASIANKYQIDEQMLISQNDLYGEDLKADMKLMLADAAIPELPKPVVQPQSNNSGSGSYSGPTYAVTSSSGPNHFPWGWCTWYVASRRYVPWSGDAHDWYYNAQAYGRPVGKTPVAGAIMVTWESGWGHVAYVESVNGGTFTVSEMNYAGWGRISSRTLTTSQVPLIGFIY